MGAHRKPKAKPTTVAVVVTAAIVVPTGTAMAATFTSIGSSAGEGSGLSAAGAHNGRAHAVVSAGQAASGRLGLTSGPSASASASLKGRVPAKQLGSASPSAGKASIPAQRTSPGAAPKTTAAKPSASAKPKPTTKATTTPAPKPDPYANLSLSSLEPTGLYGTQQYFTPSSTQWANARTIFAVTKQRGMAPYAAVIAIATAMQESSLINRTSATNYDSLGLFQQRPSMGWGTAAQITDPVYATNAFLAALKTYAPGYQTQSLWAAAQAVQRSGLPTAYAQWQAQAARMVQAISNGTA